MDLCLKDKIIITDIGSTTTKAILLVKSKDRYELLGCASSTTTVEKPDEDVRIGIYNSLKKLEFLTNYKILIDKSSKKIELIDDYNYFTTSSAGGGLQILVIGLTLLDTVCSAERAAYGAGGIVVKTLSIDDNKTNLERLQILNSTRPDIILFCGGTDGGTVYGVFRLAVNLNLSNIKQKFSENANIPLIYAGNKEAADFLKSLLKNKYNLQIIDNIRPTIRDENLEQAKEVIHNLFLNSVMELAPGYSFIKKIVDGEILPTPVAVLNTMKLLGNSIDNIIAFDMGGATTDVYTHIHGKYNRSVSANYGMSYSMGNIVLESSFSIDFKPYLMSFLGIKTKTAQVLNAKQNQTSIGSPVSYISFVQTKRHNNSLNEEIEEDEQSKTIKEYFLNYVGKKVLYPDSNPKNDFDLFIEHIIAISGIKMSVLTHFENHYRTTPTYFEKISKYIEITKNNYFKILRLVNKNVVSNIIYPELVSSKPLYYPLYKTGTSFSKSDINIIIGAGGVLAHANKIQAIFILIESLNTNGIFQLFRDKLFISPHIGVLSIKNKTDANSVLHNECLEKLAIYLRFKVRKFNIKKALLKVNIDGDGVYTIKPDDVFYKICNKPTKIVIYIKDNQKIKEFTIDQNVYLIIDTRSFNNPNSINIILDKLKPYDNIAFPLDIAQYRSGDFQSPLWQSEIAATSDSHLISYKLPMPGKMYVKQGDRVYPDTLIAENQHDLPRVFIILIKTYFKNHLTESVIRENLCIKLNDKISVGDIIFSLKDENSGIIKTLKSTYRGIVDNINYESGTIVLKEIQDYHSNPVNINVAQLLKVKNKDINLCMLKKIGDFIYKDDVLAKDYFIEGNFINSPSTGTIKKIDTKTGIVTIQYQKNPLSLYAMCYGQVETVEKEQEVIIKIKAAKITGRIGFGKTAGGRLALLENYNIESDSIVFYSKCVTYEDLLLLSDKNINGLICNTISYSCLKKFINKDIGVAITGEEILPFPIIILKGFTKESINIDNTIFLSNEGNYVLMKPQTQIRAGAIRPCLYICLNLTH